MQIIGERPQIPRRESARRFLPRGRSPHRPLAGRRRRRHGVGAAADRAPWAGAASTWRATRRRPARNCRSICAPPAPTISAPWRFLWSQGRFFSDHDRLDTPQVVIIDAEIRAALLAARRRRRQAPLVRSQKAHHHRRRRRRRQTIRARLPTGKSRPTSPCSRGWIGERSW